MTNLTDQQKRVNEFIDYVEAAGADTVAAILGFQGNLDEPEDLGEDMIYAFECLGDEDQEQALRKLAMTGGQVPFGQWVHPVDAGLKEDDWR